MQKTLVFPELTYETAQDVQSQFTAMLDSAFGQGRITAAQDIDGNITLSTQNSILTLRVPDEPENDPSGILDFGAYATNRIDLSMPLSMSGLSGLPFLDADDEISFSINEEVFTFESGTSLDQIIKEVNNSDADVVMSYSD